MDLNERRREAVDYIHVTRDRFQLRALVSMVMSFGWFHESREFIDQLSDYQFISEGSYWGTLLGMS
jgi:hypothetical protein